MVVASRPLRSGVRVASGYVCSARSMAAACEVQPRRGLQEGYVGLFLNFGSYNLEATVGSLQLYHFGGNG